MIFASPAAMLTGGMLVALLSLSAGAATAQNYNPRDAVSSRYGSMSCGEFTHLNRSARAGIVRHMVGSAPLQSLSSTTVTPGSRGNGGTRLTNGFGNGSTVPGTPLTSGQLIAACQAAGPASTLKDAYSQFNSSPNGFPNMN